MKLTLIFPLLIILSVSGTISAQNAVSEREAMTVAIEVATNQQNNGIIRTVKKKADFSNHPLLY